jgi:hypothetical protein
LLAGGRKGTISSIPDRAFRVVHPDYGHTDGIPAATPKLHHLVAQIVDYTIDLLDHGFGEDFHFHANLDRVDWPARDEVASVYDWVFAGDDFAECPVSPARRDAAPLVLDVEDGLLPANNSLDQLGGTMDCDQVFIEMHRDEIALA